MKGIQISTARARGYVSTSYSGLCYSFLAVQSWDLLSLRGKSLEGLGLGLGLGLGARARARARDENFN